MPNTTSTKKSARSSLKKRKYNMFWKKKIKTTMKSLKEKIGTKGVDTDILNKELTVLQKTLDKASKNNVLHKNKANRLKSRYAKKIAALSEKPKKSKAKAKKGSKKTA